MPAPIECPSKWKCSQPSASARSNTAFTATPLVYSAPAQPYFPEPLRSQRAGLLPQGDLIVLPGTHHLHMEDPQTVAAAIGDFFA